MKTEDRPPAIPIPEEHAKGGIAWYRWIICGLLFLATTVSYVDRQVIGILKNTLMGELSWNETDFANVIFAFQLAYALGYLLSGRLFDRIGVRIGFALAVGLWSLAAVAHGMIRSALGISAAICGVPLSPEVIRVHSLAGFSAARFGLGLAEGGNFPGAIKAVGEWFPRRERALATGIFNAGSNVGALVTPLIVPWITLRWGWPAAFYVTGAIGFFWLLLWLPIYDAPEKHPRVSPKELAHIRSDPPDPPIQIAWLELLGHRQTWAFVIGMAMSAPIWWFYLYWIAGFLQDKHGLDLTGVALPLVVIYLMTDVGSIGGGWLSSAMIKRGWSVNAARKTAMLVCALCVVPVFAAPVTGNLWLVVVLVGLAASAHQGFSANLFTLVSDTVPRQAVSSVVGIGGMAGALAGMGFAKLTGYLLDHWTSGYLVLFGIASCAYLVNLSIIHLLLPTLQPMTFAAREPR